MLTAKVKETLQKYSMLDPGDTVLVAVSGGPDSICLLSILHGLSRELNLSLHIAHLDHMFRGEESAREAVFVTETARTLDVPATVEKFDVPSYCRERGVSAQVGAREVRYAFLRKVSRRIGARRIALGHTATDQAETLVMRMLRGAGTAALSGIPPVRNEIIRPLIETTREYILDYLRASDLDYVTDSSNMKLIYMRNRVRLEIMPVFKKFNPEIVNTLASETAILRDDNEALEQYLSGIWSTVVTPGVNSMQISKKAFDALLPALKRRLLRKAVTNLTGDADQLSYSQVEDALRFMNSAQTGRTMHLVAGITLERQYGSFSMGPEPEALPFSVPLDVPGVTNLPALGLQFGTKLVADSYIPDEENYYWLAVIDYDKIDVPLRVRSKQPGDWFCPSGMGGKRKKLQDYFVDEKVPKRARDMVPIISSGSNVVWIVGMRTDERFLPGSRTKQRLIIGVSKKGQMLDAG